MSCSHNTNRSITSPKCKASHKSFRGACFVFLFWWKWPVCGAQGQSSATLEQPHTSPQLTVKVLTKTTRLGPLPHPPAAPATLVQCPQPSRPLLPPFLGHPAASGEPGLTFQFLWRSVWPSLGHSPDPTSHFLWKHTVCLHCLLLNFTKGSFIQIKITTFKCEM